MRVCECVCVWHLVCLKICSINTGPLLIHILSINANIRHIIDERKCGGNKMSMLNFIVYLIIYWAPYQSHFQWICILHLIHSIISHVYAHIHARRNGFKTIFIWSTAARCKFRLLLFFSFGRFAFCIVAVVGVFLCVFHLCILNVCLSIEVLHSQRHKRKTSSHSQKECECVWCGNEKQKTQQQHRHLYVHIHKFYIFEKYHCDRMHDHSSRSLSRSLPLSVLSFRIRIVSGLNKNWLIHMLIWTWNLLQYLLSRMHLYCFSLVLTFHSHYCYNEYFVAYSLLLLCACARKSCGHRANIW